MMDTATVTIAIPVYNRREIVRRTLDSVATQTYRPLKVILVDNNSRDGSREVLDVWAEAVSDDMFDVKVITERTPGAAAARNAALDMVDTEWVLFFDSDDTMDPGHVARAMDYISNHPEIDMLGWDVYLHNLDGTVTRKPFAIKDMLYNCIIHGTFATQRYMVRADMMRDAGGWNASVRVWNDIECATRMLVANPRANVARIDGEPMVHVYQTEVSITGMSFSHNGAGRECALACMRSVLPQHSRVIIDVKATMLSALYAREGAYDDARRLYRQTFGGVRSRWRRYLLAAVYHYTRLGGRGAASIIRPFIRHKL